LAAIIFSCVGRKAHQKFIRRDQRDVRFAKIAFVTSGNGLAASAAGFHLRSAAALRSGFVPAVSPLSASLFPPADRRPKPQQSTGFSAFRL